MNNFSELRENKITIPRCVFAMYALGYLLPGTTASFLYHKVKINREIFQIALAYIFQRWKRAVGLFLLCVVQTQQQFSDHKKGVFWYLPNFRKNGTSAGCVCKSFEHLSTRRNCSWELMLHDSAGNGLLSSAKVFVPALKILKGISKILQYEGEAFACISEAMMMCESEKRKV